ncbi:MAG: hypothetical protein DRG78_14275 [Epsilonproteobacteria bacterium]|nr:MAG: hypothetical protein DRG78_14275 [Campylobacterota bacterium]
MGNKNKNKRAESFLDTIPTASIENPTDILAQKSKFNFAYFINDNSGQDFRDWTNKQLYELLDKLKEYSKFPLTHWENEDIFVKYPQFPINSDFTIPKSIPHQAIWSRFRLESDSRLIGFVLPSEYDNNEQNKSNYRFDTNTFYVVFLDEHHRFYITA